MSFAKCLAARGRGLPWLALTLTCLSAMPAAARDLPPVKPVVDCTALAKMVLSIPDSAGRVESAAVAGADSPSPYCDVKGYVAPQVRFELHLPTTKWTQRLFFEGCGGFCGNIRLGAVRAAEGCQPADNGELGPGHHRYGAHQPGHGRSVGSGSAIARGFRLSRRACYHARGQADRARYYGQPQAFAYFNGCSDGGREAMMEAERYPDRFQRHRRRRAGVRRDQQQYDLPCLGIATRRAPGR